MTCTTVCIPALRVALWQIAAEVERKAAAEALRLEVAARAAEAEAARYESKQKQLQQKLVKVAEEREQLQQQKQELAVSLCGQHRTHSGGGSLFRSLFTISTCPTPLHDPDIYMPAQQCVLANDAGAFACHGGQDPQGCCKGWAG